jgi:dTDP-4-dehydrorhamnose reductase
LKILLLGAKGQLGRQFLEDGDLDRIGTIVAASRDGRLAEGGPCEVADLADATSFEQLLDRVRPQIIVNAAAYTAVDRAEDEPSLAARINGTAVGQLGQWAVRHQALVIHYSTDYVFDGEAISPYPVDACTAPLGAYGHSKLLGEEALRQSGADHLILRTAWVYAAHGHNFMRTMLRLAAERDELSVVADQRGAPTTTALLVNATISALNQWLLEDACRRRALQGTYHLVASGETSWYGFAKAIFERASALGLLPKAPKIVPIDSVQYPTPAKRPRYSVLDNRRFEERFRYPLTDWKTGLDEVLHKLQTQSKLNP